MRHSASRRDRARMGWNFNYSFPHFSRARRHSCPAENPEFPASLTHTPLVAVPRAIARGDDLPLPRPRSRLHGLTTEDIEGVAKPMHAPHPDKSGRPSPVRFVGAARSGLPSTVRGSPGVGWVSHWALTDWALTRQTTSASSGCFMSLPPNRQLGKTPQPRDEAAPCESLRRFLTRTSGLRSGPWPVRDLHHRVLPADVGQPGQRP